MFLRRIVLRNWKELSGSLALSIRSHRFQFGFQSFPGSRNGFSPWAKGFLLLFRVVGIYVRRVGWRGRGGVELRERREEEKRSFGRLIAKENFSGCLFRPGRRERRGVARWGLIDGCVCLSLSFSLFLCLWVKSLGLEPHAAEEEQGRTPGKKIKRKNRMKEVEECWHGPRLQ